jgi:hypothetical protein
LGHLGAEYGVILHDPQLRDGFRTEAERSARAKAQAAEKPRASVRLRFQFARVLRALAVRVEPRVARESEVGSIRPVFAE